MNGFECKIPCSNISEGFTSFLLKFYNGCQWGCLGLYVQEKMKKWKVKIVYGTQLFMLVRRSYLNWDISRYLNSSEVTTQAEIINFFNNFFIVRRTMCGTNNT